jgi:hypothetical protein
MGSRPAVAAIFLSTGFMFGTWAARLPAVKAELDLSDAGLAVALLTLEGGALLGLPLGGWLVLLPAALVVALAPLAGQMARSRSAQ